jgi:hypothetical protein
MRKLLVVAALLAALGSGGPARASRDCYSYNVNTPTAGRKTDGSCVPANNPGGFTMYRQVGNCPTVDQYGGCVSVTVWLPV